MYLFKKLTKNSLKLKPLRTFLTILGISLSTALIVAVLTLFSCGRESFLLYKKINDGDWHVKINSVNESDIDRIEDLSYVERASIVRSIGFNKNDKIKNIYKPYIKVVAFDDNALKTLGVSLIEGRLPENENEIVLPSNLYTNGGFRDWKVGDEITLNLGERKIDNEVRPLFENHSYDPETDDALVNEKPYTYTVVGRVKRMPYLIEGSTDAAYTVITRLDPNDKKSYPDNDLSLYLRLNKKALKDIDNKIKELTGKESSYTDEYGFLYLLNFSLIDLEKDFLSNDNIKMIFDAGLLALIIIIAASVICIRNSFKISINEKVKQYGMLRSIGATKSQVKKNVLYEAFILGAFGIPAGIIIGLFSTYILILISSHFVDFLSDDFGAILRFKIDFYYIAFGILLSALTVFLSALSGVFTAGKVSPLDAIRTGGERRNIKLSKRDNKNKYKNIILTLARKNHTESRRKYRTTVLSIMTCVSLFIAMSGFVKMFYDTISLEYNNIKYDLQVQLATSEPEDFKETTEFMKNLGGVSRFTIRKGTAVSILNSNLTERFKRSTDDEKDTYIIIYAVSDDELLRIADEIKCKDSDVLNKGVLIDTEVFSDEETEMKMIKKFNYKPGDVITVKEEESDKEPFDIELSAVTDQRSFSYSDSQFSSLIVSESFYDKNFSKNVVNIHYYFKTDDPDSVQKIAEDYLNSDDIEKKIVHFENLNFSVNNVSENRSKIESFIMLLSIFLYGFIAVIAFIGITNIINTVITNTELRKSEYAMLLSVGMSDMQLLKMIFYEYMIIALSSIITGVPIGIFLSFILGTLLEVNFFTIPFLGIFISILAVFLLLSILTFFSYNRFKGQNIIETIRERDI